MLSTGIPLNLQCDAVRSARMRICAHTERAPRSGSRGLLELTQLINTSLQCWCIIWDGLHTLTGFDSVEGHRSIYHCKV